MNLRTFWYGVSIIGLLGLVFYFGFLYGIREKVNSQADSVDITGPNGARKNFLTNIDRRPILGPSDTKTINTYGEMLFIQPTGDETQILITLKDIPTVIKQTATKKEKVIPKELNIALAKRTIDGLDYEYEVIGKIYTQSSTFSTILDKPLFGPKASDKIERIEFKETKVEDESLFKDDNSNLPVNVRNRPAPYFWINI